MLNLNLKGVFFTSQAVGRYSWRERTEGEHRALLKAAGFRAMKVIPRQSEMSVVECGPV